MSKRGNVNVNEAMIALSAMDPQDYSLIEVLTAGTGVDFVQKTESPYLVIVGDKAFYFKYGTGATAANGQLWPANTVLRLFGNISLVGQTGIVTAATLSMNATTKDKFDHTAFAIKFDGVAYSIGAAANKEFSAVQTVNTGAAASTLWGAWLVQSTVAGVISTKAAGGLTDQVFATENEAIDRLPGADAGNVAIGYITVQVKASQTFTTNTTEFDDAVVVNDANFYSYATPGAAERFQGPTQLGPAFASRIGGVVGFNAPANNTKISVTESY